jgi:hnh endonuclease
MSEITEKQLVLPALYMMAKSDNGFISTSDLISQLTTVMHPTGIDAQILAKRKDTHFSQKVRNLKSHDTLVKLEYATDYENGFKLTQKGYEYLDLHKEAIDYLLQDEFNYEDVKTAFDDISSSGKNKVLPIKEVISEGRLVTRNVQVRERSTRLRDIAIEHFTSNGVISCQCCGFNFPIFYGPIYGKDCIEIHHVKPIFQYEENTFEQVVENALENLLPVCPNCHRVIHKNHIGSESMSLFINEMKTHTPLNLSQPAR